MNYIELHSEIPTIINSLKLIGSTIELINIADSSVIYTPKEIYTAIPLAQTFIPTIPARELEVSFFETRTGSPNSDLRIQLTETTGRGLQPDLDKVITSITVPISSLTPDAWNTLPILKNFILVAGVDYAIVFSLVNVVLIDVDNKISLNLNTDVALDYIDGTSYTGGWFWSPAGADTDDFMLRIRYSSEILSPDILEVNGISGVGVGALVRIDEPIISLAALFTGVTNITKYYLNSAEVETEQEVLDGLNDGFISSVYVEGTVATTVGLALHGFVGCWYITNPEFRFTDFLEVTNNTLWFNPHKKDHRKYTHYFPMNQLINTNEIENFTGTINATTTSSIFWPLDQLRISREPKALLINPFDVLTIDGDDSLQLSS